MIESYRNKAAIAIGVGMILSIGTMAGSFASMDPRHSLPSGSGAWYAIKLAGLFGFWLFLYGCVLFAKAKARSGWWGAFGLLTYVGLVVLFCLRDDAPERPTSARG